jgi:hypothetical protein
MKHALIALFNSKEVNRDCELTIRGILKKLEAYGGNPQHQNQKMLSKFKSGASMSKSLTAPAIRMVDGVRGAYTFTADMATLQTLWESEWM